MGYPKFIKYKKMFCHPYDLLTLLDLEHVAKVAGPLE